MSHGMEMYSKNNFASDYALLVKMISGKIVIQELSHRHDGIQELLERDLQIAIKKSNTIRIESCSTFLILPLIFTYKK
ncbi:hypothetical protein GCM10008933_22030 [Paenibacillus motobuensis]|uniref:Uncharacterized protein n=1 Tax=Paenibacillus motobuensis TaxID=295324 RepID=A0ABP3I564_9BACL